MLATLLDIFGGGASRRESSLEDPSTSLADDAAIGFDDSALIDTKKAVRIAAVWQALMMISGDVAKMPLDVYKRMEPQGRERDFSHPAEKLLRRRANDYQTAFRVKRVSIIHLLLWGNAYQYIERDRSGRPLGIYSLLPDRTEPHRRGGELWYVTETKLGLRWIPAADVIHLQGFSFDGFEGYELLRAARDSWLIALDQGRFTSRFYRSGGTMGGILEIPREASEGYATKLEEGWRKRYESSDSWFRTAILRDGAKFHNASFSPSDADFVNSSEREVREVARWFNLPPSRLGLSDSVSYGSKSESNQEYLDTTLDPILVDYEQEAEAKLIGNDSKRYIEFNRMSILRLNPKDQAQINAIDIRNGVLCPDEVRAMRNLPARPDGKGSEYIALNRVGPAGGADKGENDAPRGEGKSQIDQTADEVGVEDDSGDSQRANSQDDDRIQARRRLVYQIGARARHKARNHRAWQEFLGGNLASFRRESVELLGDDALVSEIVDRLQATQEVRVSDLAQTVETIVAEFERAA